MSLDKIDSWYDSELNKLVLELKEKLALSNNLRDREYAIDNFKSKTKDLRSLYYKQTKLEIEKDTADKIRDIKGIGKKNELEKKEASKKYEDEILESRRELERLSEEAEIKTKKLEAELVAQTKRERRKIVFEVKLLKFRVLKGKLNNRMNLFARKYITPKLDYLKLKQKKLNDDLFPIVEKIKEYARLLK